MVDNKTKYRASASVAFSIASLPSSSGLVLGWSSLLIDNTVDLNLDFHLSLKTKTGTGLVVGVIEAWIIPTLDDTPNYFDTFTGADVGVTVSSREALVGYGTLLKAIPTNATNSKVYGFNLPIGGKWGSVPPTGFQVFVTHNTGSILSATGGDHGLKKTAVYTTS